MNITLQERLLNGQRLIEASKQKMATKHNIARDAKFEKAWALAWDFGHASGLNEVEMYFDDLAELLKP